MMKHETFDIKVADLFYQQKFWMHLSPFKTLLLYLNLMLALPQVKGDAQ